MLDTLHSVPIFKELDVRHIELLRTQFESFSCPAETIVFEQGEPAVYLYIILNGTVVIRYKPYDGTSMTLTRLHEGDAFGWSAVIGNPAYTTTLMSKTKLDAIRVKGADLRYLCTKYPDTGEIILDRLAQLVSRRWKDAHLQVRKLLAGRGRSNPKDVTRIKV